MRITDLDFFVNRLWRTQISRQHLPFREPPDRRGTVRYGRRSDLTALAARVRSPRLLPFCVQVELMQSPTDSDRMLVADYGVAAVFSCRRYKFMGGRRIEQRSHRRAPRPIQPW